MFTCLALLYGEALVPLPSPQPMSRGGQWMIGDRAGGRKGADLEKGKGHGWRGEGGRLERGRRRVGEKKEQG